MDLWIERTMEVNIGLNKKVHVNFYLNAALHKKPRENDRKSPWVLIFN